MLGGEIASLLAAVPCWALAQAATKLPRVVVVLGGNEASAGPFVDSFLEGMREAGEIRGLTIQIDFRYAEFAAVRSLISEVAAETPAVLVVGGGAGRTYQLPGGHPRQFPPRSRLRRQDPEGRQTRRPSHLPVGAL